MYAVRNWLIGGALLLALAISPPDCRATSVPDTINLDSMVQLFDKVKFDHAKHINLTKDCANCHHHTTGTLIEDSNCVRCHRNSSQTKVVSCRGCHVKEPFSATALKDKDRNTYHLDKPGLKGAYHQSCIGCHSKMGGPVGCQDCHKRTKAGDAFYNAGEFTPKPGSGKAAH